MDEADIISLPAQRHQRAVTDELSQALVRLAKLDAVTFMDVLATVLSEEADHTTVADALVNAARRGSVEAVAALKVLGRAFPGLDERGVEATKALLNFGATGTGNDGGRASQ